MERFVAKLDYNDGKFAMKAGDIVTCEQRHEGWCGGTNLRTQQRGWYPFSYAESILPPPPHSLAPTIGIPMATAVPIAGNNASSFPQVAHQQHQSHNSATKQSPFGNQNQREAPPSWATSQPYPAEQTNFQETHNPVKKIGQWFQDGLGNSSVGTNNVPTQQVYNTTTMRTGSGGFFSGSSAQRRTTAVQQVPSNTGAGRLAKRVGDGAVLSAVWGATTTNPRQILKAAAIATTAYAVEGNQRVQARNQQDEFLRQQEEQHRRDEEERRKKSWW